MPTGEGVAKGDTMKVIDVSESKMIYIACKNVICRGERIGDVYVTGIVKQPGECKNYGTKEQPNWYIEMNVIKSSGAIPLGYAYLKQVEDGFAGAEISFVETATIDITGKTVLVMDNEASDIIMETLSADEDSSFIDRNDRSDISRALKNIQPFYNCSGKINIERIR